MGTALEEGGCAVLQYLRTELAETVAVLSKSWNVSLSVGVTTHHGTLGFNAGNNDVWDKNQLYSSDVITAVGSVTKPFTAVAAMKLSEQGKLDLEEKAHVRL